MSTLEIRKLVFLVVGLVSSTASAQQTGNHAQQPPILDYAWQRSRSVLPIHPEKPCAICTRPDIPLVFPKLGQLPGWKGRPYIPTEPGGCECGNSQCRRERPYVSQYWPRPFYAVLEERHGHQSSCQPKFYDVFDQLKDFKLIDYRRTDNGLCGNNCFGRNRDPFGCLGESRFWSQHDGRALSGMQENGEVRHPQPAPVQLPETAPGPHTQHLLRPSLSNSGLWPKSKPATSHQAVRDQNSRGSTNRPIALPSPSNRQAYRQPHSTNRRQIAPHTAQLPARYPLGK